MKKRDKATEQMFIETVAWCIEIDIARRGFVSGAFVTAQGIITSNPLDS